ncbi:hypothetical protein ACIPPM_11520 [Streptomyces sp. NPDC090119]|uniref:hypothetical protein n=1 Tax=Streptomyces sp. NPDC090119 TaxID=3365951 RepID=UPI00380116E1
MGDQGSDGKILDIKMADLKKTAPRFQTHSLVASTFKYRFRSPLGGLAADLTADFLSPDQSHHTTMQVGQKIHLALPDGTHWRDAAWLSFGLSVHAPDLMQKHPEGLVVNITSLTYPVAHFRSEVAALAMDGWLKNELGVPDRGLQVTFDKEADRYDFTWGDLTNPFGDDL